METVYFSKYELELCNGVYHFYGLIEEVCFSENKSIFL